MGDMELPLFAEEQDRLLQKKGEFLHHESKGHDTQRRSDPGKESPLICQVLFAPLGGLIVHLRPYDESQSRS